MEERTQEQSREIEKMNHISIIADFMLTVKTIREYLCEIHDYGISYEQWIEVSKEEHFDSALELAIELEQLAVDEVVGLLIYVMKAQNRDLEKAHEKYKKTISLNEDKDQS